MNAVLFHDQYVEPVDQEALVAGLVDIGEQLGRAGGLEIVTGEIDGDSFTKLPSGQVDSGAVLDSFPAWPQRSLVVVATGLDLGAKGLNFLFGRSSLASGKAIFSTHRLGGNALAIMGVEIHELGHAYGLVGDHESRYDRVSRFAGHCMNDCIMRPANDLREMLEGADRIRHMPETSGFCDDCANHLNRIQFAEPDRN